MAILSNILLMVLLAVVINNSECSLEFFFTPEKISVVDNTPLQIDCMFNLKDEDELLKNQEVGDLEIQSLSVTKLAKERGQHQTVASINSVNTDIRKQVTEDGNIILVGKMRKPVSFLQVEFMTPKQTDSGDYSCDVTVVSKKDGLPYTLTKQIYIPDESTVGLLHEVETLRQTLKTELKQKIINLEAKYDKDVNKRVEALDQKYEKELKVLGGWKEKVMGYYTQSYEFVRSKEYNNRTYAISNLAAYNFNEAKSICEVLGGYLFEFDDSKEWTFVTSFLKNNFPDASFYIGASDATKEGEFRWLHSNKLLEYAPWGPNEPNDQSGNEDCLEIKVVNDEYGLNDIACHPRTAQGEKDRIICEIPN